MVFPESGAEGPDLVLRSTGSTRHEEHGRGAEVKDFQGLAVMISRAAPQRDVRFELEMEDVDSRLETGHWDRKLRTLRNNRCS